MASFLPGPSFVTVQKEVTSVEITDTCVSADSFCAREYARHDELYVSMPKALVYILKSLYLKYYHFLFTLRCIGPSHADPNVV